MTTRKIQRLGPSTLAMTLPAEWARETSVSKGDEVSVQSNTKGSLTVLPESVETQESETTIHVGDWDAEAIERAIIAQYVLGRCIINIESEDSLETDHISAVYEAESQLMGVGVIEETPASITVRCSVDPKDFTLDNLLERLENTGRTMRKEAITALDRSEPMIANRALNRERQANKIFVLLLRLIFSADQNPALAQRLDIGNMSSLIGYRSVAKNLELTADKAEDIANSVLNDNNNQSLNLDKPIRHQIVECNDKVDEMTTTAVQAVIKRDYELVNDVRTQFHQINNQEQEMLTELPEMANKEVLKIREILVSLQQTAEYAMRNAEIAANLALNQESDHVTIA